MKALRLGSACLLALAAAAAPVVAFDDPAAEPGAESLPEHVRKQLYCAEVLLTAAGARMGEGVRRFEMRIAASHLLTALAEEALADGGRAGLSDIPSEVEADQEAGTLRYSEAECLALVRRVEKMAAPAEADRLVSCSQLFYIRSAELAAAGDDAAGGAAYELSIALGVRALEILQAGGLTFTAALDVTQHNGLLEQIALGEEPAPVPEEQCRALAQPGGDAGALAN